MLNNEIQYKCKHFVIEELVPPQVFKDRGQKAWELLDVRALMTIDALREKFGSMTINNWKWNGDRQWSGLRTSDSPYYSPYSQHSFGRAFDCIFKDISTEEVRVYILENPEEFPYIKGIELDGTKIKVSWLHFDVRNVDTLSTFRP